MDTDSFLDPSHKANVDAYEKLLTVVDSTGIGIWDWDVETGEVSFNQRWAEIIGYSLEELAPLSIDTWMKYAHPDDLEKSNQRLQAYWRGETPRYVCESRMRHKKGHWVWVMDSGEVVEWLESGKPKRMVGTHLDITASKLVEERLHRQQQMFEVMSEQARIGAWELDLIEGRIFWSSMTRDIHEVPPDFEPDLEKGINFYKAGYSRDKITEIVRKGIEHGTPWNVELQIVTAKGRELWVAATGKAIFENGRAVRLFGSFQDIDERKKTEQALMLAKDDAELAGRVKSEFLAIMSHEIRTPLNGVMGMLNLLNNSKLDSEQLRKIQIAHSSAQSLLTIINDILDFSKIDAGHMELKVEAFDLRKLLEEASESLALRAQEKGLEMVLDLSDVSLDLVRGDEGRLRQIVINLLGNAVKFTDNGHVYVYASLRDTDQGHRLHVKVEDTGIGIEEERLKAVFEPFTQLDSSSTRQYGGTGLGLAICKKLSDLMGGRLWAASKENEGTRFEFEVDLASSDRAGYVRSPVELHGHNILVIEQNALARATISRQLEQWGANVAVANSYVSGLQICAERQASDKPLALIFVSGRLSDSSADDFADAYKQQFGEATVPLVLVNTMDDKFALNSLQALGFAVQIPKPVIVKDYRAALALLDKAPVCPEVDRGATPAAIDVADKTRILLVEDNGVNQEVALMMLEDLGMCAEIAENGQQAIDLMNSADDASPYTIVLMDCQMPIMDGYEATRSIRNGAAGDRHRAIPIVAMTANAMKGDSEKCLEAGMNDYLAKPFDDDELGGILKRWI